MIIVHYDLGMTSSVGPPRGGGVAFLLAQVGAHAMTRFAAALSPLDLTPPLVGIMRVLSSAPGLSQNALADRLGMAPSRVVAYVDLLESLRVGGTGAAPLGPPGQPAHRHRPGPAGPGRDRRGGPRPRTGHDAGLDDDERTALASLLGRVAAEQGLVARRPPRLPHPLKPSAQLARGKPRSHLRRATSSSPSRQISSIVTS